MGQAPPAQAGLLGIKVSQQQGVKQKIRRDFGVRPEIRWHEKTLLPGSHSN